MRCEERCARQGHTHAPHTTPTISTTSSARDARIAAIRSNHAGLFEKENYTQSQFQSRRELNTTFEQISVGWFTASEDRLVRACFGRHQSTARASVFSNVRVAPGINVKHGIVNIGFAKHLGTGSTTTELLHCIHPSGVQRTATSESPKSMTIAVPMSI